MIDYENFVPVTPGMKLPEGQTFKADLIYKDGHKLENQDLNRYTLMDSKSILAVRFHKPVTLFERIVKGLDWNISSHNALKLKAVLEKEGLLKVDGQPSDSDEVSRPYLPWLERKMDELGIMYSVSRAKVAQWFMHPSETATCDEVLKENTILTKKANGNGHCVVLPTGHTIAYSTAKEIWLSIKTGDATFLNLHPTVGEYSVRRYQRGGTWNYSKKHRLTIGTRGVTVGCQFVPMQAIREFAEREGW